MQGAGVLVMVDFARAPTDFAEPERPGALSQRLCPRGGLSRR